MASQRNQGAAASKSQNYDSLQQMEDEEEGFGSFNVADEPVGSSGDKGTGKESAGQSMEDKYGENFVSWYRMSQSQAFGPMKYGIILSVPLSIAVFSLFVSTSTASLVAFTAFAISCSFIVFSLWLLGQILDHSQGTRAMQEIAEPIREGSEGFFMTQYGTIFKLAFVSSIALFLIYAVRDPVPGSPLNLYFSTTGMAFITMISFLIGAGCSAISGYAGIWVSVRANLRVAAACRTDYNEALQVCFRGGAFAAIINVALALFGISLLFMLMSLHFYMNAPTPDTLPPIEEIPVLWGD